MAVYGVMNRYIYGPDEETGYAVLRVRIDRGKYIICSSRGCAVPDDLTEGTPLELKGNYIREPDSRFPFTGEDRYSFTSISVTMPRDEKAAIEYIVGLSIKGLKEKSAEKIISVTGPDISGYFLMNPGLDTLAAKAKGIPMKTLEALYKKVVCAPAYKDFYDIFSYTGVSYKLIYKLYRAIKNTFKRECTAEEALEYLAPKPTLCPNQESTDCYELCIKLGFLFTEADAVAKIAGFRAYDKERLRTYVHEVMKLLSESGHVWSTRADIVKKVKSLTPRTAFPDDPISKNAVYSVLKKYSESKEYSHLFAISDDEEKIYLIELYDAEFEAGENANRIKKSARPLKYDDKIIETLESEHGMKYSESQKRCFGFLRRSGVKIITGEAGTGKTTVISSLLEAYTRMNPDKTVALCAPTGRAAQRMTELCKRFGQRVKASTIHRLLNFVPFGDDCKAEFDENNPLDIDFIIVDEMSMVDVLLFSRLLRAIKSGTLVILCGDVEQLPSVAAGKVFRDMIDSGIFANDFVRLTVNYRQADDSANEGLIIKNATKINRGMNDIAPGEDFNIIYCNTDEEIKEKVIELIKADTDQTVLSPVKAGPAGVNELNRSLQPLVNPGKESFKYGKTEFCPGDKILMNRNNYSIGYVNGDTGTIKSVSQAGLVIEIGTERKVITHDCMSDVSLAYAMTVHKSQGGEYGSVIIAIPTTAKTMLARNMLYTAVTRAKRKVTIIALKGALETAIATTKDNERRTTLKDFLKETRTYGSSERKA